VVTGTVFTAPKTDLWLPGRFTLDFRRSYSSAHRDVDLGMGFGWTHSLAWTLEENGPLGHLMTGDGRRVEFPRLREPGEVTSLRSWRILKGDGFYVVRPGSEFDHFFEPVEPGSKRYRLKAVKYRNRGMVSLQYERGRLARVVDAVGRV